MKKPDRLHPAYRPNNAPASDMYSTVVEETVGYFDAFKSDVSLLDNVGDDDIAPASGDRWAGNNNPHQCARIRPSTYRMRYRVDLATSEQWSLPLMSRCYSIMDVSTSSPLWRLRFQSCQTRHEYGPGIMT